MSGARDSPGLAVGAIVCGGIGLLLSPLLVGFGLGLLGLAFGIVHLALGRRPRAMAVNATSSAKKSVSMWPASASSDSEPDR